MFTLNYEVFRNLEIAVPPAKIHSALINFKTWPDWSPWLCMDKQAELNYFGTDGTEGSGYDWSGEWVGMGRLSHTKIEPLHLEMRLEFFKPWKSKCKVGFDFQAKDADNTLLSWWMQGQLPLWLFFMKTNMQAMIGMDYHRGLLMLKDYLETGHVYSDTEVNGVVETEAQPYVGIRERCSFDRLESSMENVFERLQESMEQLSLDAAGPPFTIYHDWDMKKQVSDYTLAYPMSKDLSHKDVPLIKDIRPAVKALKITHTGDYKHLGNAWMTGYSRSQNNHAMKLNKKIPGFEIYVNDPEATASQDLQTEIYIPVQ